MFTPPWISNERIWINYGFCRKKIEGTHENSKPSKAFLTFVYSGYFCETNFDEIVNSAVSKKKNEVKRRITMKFCKHCGRELNGKERCSCPESSATKKKLLFTAIGVGLIALITIAVILITPMGGNPAQDPTRETSKSIFAGDAFEFMHGRGPGKCGHIGIRTYFVDRAIAYFKRLGFEFDESSITYDDKTGKPKFVYFKDEICGFAIHLVQK